MSAGTVIDALADIRWLLAGMAVGDDTAVDDVTDGLDRRAEVLVITLATAVLAATGVIAEKDGHDHGAVTGSLLDHLAGVLARASLDDLDSEYPE